jgi:hypothetical protein
MGPRPVTAANGAVPDSDSVTFTSPGTYYRQAVHSDDANGNKSLRSCGSEVLTLG